MIDKANMNRGAEPFAPRQGSALSRAEAEGKGNEFREAMRQEAAMGRVAEPSALRQDSALPMAKAEGKGNEFREAMRQDTEKSGTPGKFEGRLGNEGEGLAETGRKTRALGEKADPASPPLFSGDALLRSLGGSYAPLETQAAAPSPARDTPSLAADLAERILVDTDNRAAGGEVRIVLRDAVLPDTEIVLRREGERLVVQLVSGNSASLDALRLAQEDLRGRLQALDREISVDVLDKRNRENEDSGHSGHRSRGLDYFPESED